MNRFALDGTTTQDQIADIRRFVERFYAGWQDRELVSRVAMATHELFENAVKFSSDGITSLAVDVLRDEVPHHIRITTKNRAHRANVASLNELSDALGRATDMMTFYVNLMRRSDRAARGGLGIGRVAAEADMRLEMNIDDDLVTVRAELEECA